MIINKKTNIEPNEPSLFEIKASMFVMEKIIRQKSKVFHQNSDLLARPLKEGLV